eukprot:CAMPEP_0206464844 /NCGR_PEP_ID=MMETSP0324_2-20121206/27459_1 /ASSEMBLY_ACC=CAM_ASM_000836 /TAXON_ID=2866 /ORGANISM="Crypthecodinium cohnii, Strain Seligo" /LENGTH=128 /DNA_ID=CAMNT_0053937555 /DNA_START=64 /DNA_END=450 /DNA_ORIENTATION=+
MSTQHAQVLDLSTAVASMNSVTFLITCCTRTEPDWLKKTQGNTTLVMLSFCLREVMDGDSRVNDGVLAAERGTELQDRMIRGVIQAASRREKGGDNRKEKQGICTGQGMESQGRGMASTGKMECVHSR